MVSARAIAKIGVFSSHLPSKVFWFFLLALLFTLGSSRRKNRALSRQVRRGSHPPPFTPPLLTP